MIDVEMIRAKLLNGEQLKHIAEEVGTSVAVLKVTLGRKGISINRLKVERARALAEPHLSEGLTPAQLAKKIGMSECMVRRAVPDLKDCRKKLSAEDLSMVKEMRANRRPVKEIAERFKVTQDAIYKQLRKMSC